MLRNLPKMNLKLLQKIYSKNFITNNIADKITKVLELDHRIIQRQLKMN